MKPYFETELGKLYNGDCLVESNRIEDASIDLIVCDPPYGNMNTDGGRKLGINGWDIIIEPQDIFRIANRVLRKNGKLILFSQEPYTSQLITQAIPNLPFNYRAIWEKDNFANALGVNKNMVSFTEDILIFTKKECYDAIHPLKKIFKKYEKNSKEYIENLFLKEGRYTSELSAKVHASYKMGWNKGMRFDLMDEKLFNYLNKFLNFKESYMEIKKIHNNFKKQYKNIFNLWEGNKYKSNILKYKKDYDGYHPTQKPILLLEDLIKTYSNENDTILDLTMGSGSTGVACKNANRKFIGIELDKKYFKIAKERIENKQEKLF